MPDMTFTYDRVSDLRPCKDGFRAAAEKLGGVVAWKTQGFTFLEMSYRDIPFDDLLWLAEEASRKKCRYRTARSTVVC